MVGGFSLKEECYYSLGTRQTGKKAPSGIVGGKTNAQNKEECPLLSHSLGQMIH